MKKKPLWTLERATEWIDEQLDQQVKHFSKAHRPQLVSFRDWCRDWKWAQRSDVYTHQIHSYPAKLLPYIPIAFLTSSYCNAKDKVMDPFAGTGTVLLESILHEYMPRDCYGIEINPLARLIAKVKTTPLEIERLTDLAKTLLKSIERTKTSPVRTFSSIDFWFRKAAQRDLAKIRHCIEELDATSDERDFFWVCFSSIIRDMSRADPDIAPPVLFKPGKFPKNRREEADQQLKMKNNANAVSFFKKRISANIQRMSELVEAFSGRYTPACKIIWDDARDIRLGKYTEKGRILKDAKGNSFPSVGMVITSPPYMAAQKYIRTTKLELAWLGLSSEEEISSLDRSIIGTERVSNSERKKLFPVGNKAVDKLLKKVHRSNPDRAAIGSRYYRDMREAFKSIHQCLKPSGVCVLVVGNNTINGCAAKNHKILSEIAEENGSFTTELILRDPIRSRGLITKRHETAGLIDDEYVVVLRKNPESIRTDGGRGR